MFQGHSTLRKRAEAVTQPACFRDLTNFDSVQGRPLTTVTSGFYTPVPVNLSMTPSAAQEPTPFLVGALVSR